MHPIFGVSLSLLVVIALVCVVSFFCSKYMLQVSYYTVNTRGIEKSLRIVQLTDLHNSVFGPKNRRLVEKVAAQSPDLIFVTGDTVNQNKSRTDIAENLIRKLCEIAPVYYAYGNHEAEHEQRWGSNFQALMENAGATVVESSYVDVEVKGQSLRIGGIYGYCLPDMDSEEDFEAETVFLTQFQQTERCKILLCHMPVCWLLNGSLDYWKIDLVFSGHVHGGQIIFPFVGGLYAPDMGFFPGKLSGVYDSEDSDNKLILSRGLGSTEKIPRMNNLPEILVADIIPEK